MAVVIDNKKMRSISFASELIFRTIGIDSLEVELKSFKVTNSYTQFVVEWSGRGTSVDVKIEKNKITDKWIRAEYNKEFESQMHKRFEYIKNELYSDDDVNDEIFENQEYDPARGYVDKKDVEGQEVMQLEDSKGE